MPNLANLAFQASEKLGSLVGNPGQMINPKTYNNILDSSSGVSQYLVIITSQDVGYSVKGLMTNNLSLNVDAKWEAAGLIDAITSNPALSTLYNYATTFAGAAGIANPSNLGVSSKKIYTNSGYLEFSIQFRVIDWQGTGEPVKSAFMLSTMCLPKNLKSMSSGETIGAASAAVGGVIGNIAGGNADFIDGLLRKMGVALEGLSAAAIKGIREGIEKQIPILKATFDYFDDPQFLVLASAPLPVMIHIGQYFKHNDMVVESVKMEFSRQSTSAGPLYADFDIGVSSRRAILLDDSGSSPEIGLFVNNKPRVTHELVGPVQQ